MQNVCKINRASLYTCKEDGVNVLTQAVKQGNTDIVDVIRQDIGCRIRNKN